jgi:Fic family protein
MLEILTKSVGARTQEDYLPWDKLRYKTPPDGLTHEEWWLTTKMSRQAMQRKLPLTDAKGGSFTYALTDEILKAVEEINRDVSGHIGVEDQVPDASMRDRYIINSLMEEAITSSQLEGASTTRPVAKEMIRSGREPRTRDELMILNNYRAMQRIRDLRKSPLTSDRVLEIHRIVTDGTLDKPEAAGRLQLADEQRVAVYSYENDLLHSPPPADQLPDRLERLCEFANGDLDHTYVPPVVRAIILHFMIAYDHPFEDGNGRTARAVFYWSLLNSDYWLAEFLSISKILKAAPAKYARSFLYCEQDDNDLTYFIIYQLAVIRRAIKELHAYLARKLKEMQELKSSLIATPGEFNHRQLALLERAIKNPAAHYTALSHATSHAVARETARQDLLDLEQRGLLTKQRVGKGFVWTPHKELSRLLRGEGRK